MHSTLEDGQQRQVSTARPIPLGYEISQEISIKFEEGLYEQALSSLKELLTSGIGRDGKMCLPKSEHLALICTLAVHPAFTNRAKDETAKQVSIEALEYLRMLHTVTTPTQTGYADAYTWAEAVSSRRTLRIRREEENGEQSAFADGLGHEMRSPYATNKSIWASSGDLWVVIGWAFRCSLVHTRRWKQAWLPWLRYMIDVIEKDWTTRIKMSAESAAESLIVKYYGKREQKARILRAIFADDSDRAAAEFKEIWRNETKPPPLKKQEAELKKQEVKPEEGEFGDYLDPSSQEEESNDEAEANDTNNEESFESTGAAQEDLAIWGGQEAAILRLRLLGLLGRVHEALPQEFGELQQLLNQAIDYLRPLPLNAFVAAFAPQLTSVCFSKQFTVHLLRYITHTLIQSGTKPVKSSSNSGGGGGGGGGVNALLIDQDTLTTSYLPYTANTNLIVDNARISICLEYLMMSIENLTWSEDLEVAIWTGVNARGAKATRVKGTKGEASGFSTEEADRAALTASSARLSAMAELLAL